jgi:hypothetical protein
MIKTGVFRSPSLGLTTFFAAMFLFNSGALASSKLPLFEVPGSVAMAISIDTQHSIKPCQSAAALKVFDSRRRKHRGQDYIETSCHHPSTKTDHGSLAKLTQSKPRTMLFFCDGNLADAVVGTIQIASASGYKYLLWEDKEYPCLTE